MDLTINRYLTTICLLGALSLSGYAWGWVSQPLQDRTSIQSNLQYGPEADSLEKAKDGWMSELPQQAYEFVMGYKRANGTRLERMRDRSASHLRTIDHVLATHGIPSELRYLAVIESNLDSRVVSNKGAAGPWQIMPETGRSLGLRVDGSRDERVDLVKSTHASAKYLKSLYKEFGDWLLVIAAYNGGPGRVRSAIRQSKSRDFWSLQNYLPAESRNHVKKYIATHYIMEGKGGETTGMAKAPEANRESVDTTGTVVQVVSGKFNSFVMAKSLSMDIIVFNTLNPGFDQKVGGGDYRLRLPEDKMTIFISKKSEIVAESVRYIMEAGSTEMDRNKAQSDLPPVRLP
jgi:membrane-bound lytic murein transglycosylase D